MTKVMKDMKFDDILNNRVDMERVELESIKPWISKRIIELTKQEDEVLIEYIYNQLEPKYPDPREIQTNLSGFLSFTNARVFIAELWKQLINSMESDDNFEKENKRITSDKIKSFPRLGPTESKTLNNDVMMPHKYTDQKDGHHYRSTSSRSDSISIHHNHRNKSKSNSKSEHRTDSRHKYKSKSRTKSSSRYTPYTRYSRYTDSYESSSGTSSSIPIYYPRRISYSSSSSSSNSKSKASTILNSKPSRTETHDEQYSNSSNLHSSPNPNIDELEIIENEACVDVERFSKEADHISLKSSEDVDSDQQSSISDSSSDSISFVSPRNSKLRKSRSLSDSSSASSSEYSIEYMDKTLLMQYKHYSNEDESESEVEWITNEDYQKLLDNKTISDSSVSSSPYNSFSDSENSFNDIQWIEEHQLDGFSDEYVRI